MFIDFLLSRGWKILVFLLFLHMIFKGVPKERQRSILEGFGGSLRALWGVLLGMSKGLRSFLVIILIQNKARNFNMKVLRVILAQVEVARGSQRLSRGRSWKDV